MSTLVALHNIGSLVVPVTSVFPQNAAAGTINGASIDRVSHNMANSCVLHQVVGADSGALRRWVYPDAGDTDFPEIIADLSPARF